MNERFVISVNGCGVDVLDTDNVSGENLLIFSVDFEDNEVVASYLAEELVSMVKILNEQDKELKKMGIEIP